jgi:hypothetical protein
VFDRFKSLVLREAGLEWGRFCPIINRRRSVSAGVPPKSVPPCPRFDLLLFDDFVGGFIDVFPVFPGRGTTCQ